MSNTTDSSESSSGVENRRSIMATNDCTMVKSKPEFADLEPGANKMSQQEHGRTRNRYVDLSRTSINSISKASLTSSIANFRCDFEDLKCKMTIFGESLNLCRCIADDFKNKLSLMERRLQHLEKRQKNFHYKSETNYSTIIRKNKRLSNRTLCEAKADVMPGDRSPKEDLGVVFMQPT